MRRLPLLLLLASSALQTISKNICEPSDPTTPFFDPDFQIPEQKTPVVNDEYKASRMIGFQSSSECFAVLKHLNYVSQISSDVRNYMNLAFLLPEFTIKLFHTDEEFGDEGASAGYSKGTRILHLPSASGNLQEYHSFLRHEFRHAAMHAVQILLSNNSKTLSTYPFFPNTPLEKDKFNRMLKKGDKRLNQLSNMLNKEAAEQLNSKGQERLKKLREETREEYQKYYKMVQKMELSEEQEKKSNHQLEEEFKSTLGPVQVRKNRVSSQTMILELTFEDPLYAAVHIIRGQTNYILQNDIPEFYLLEREAYLWGNIPQKILHYLYPELMNYTQDLIVRATSIPFSGPRRTLPTFLTASENNRIGNLKLLDPEAFDENLIPYYLDVAREAIAMGDIEAAETGLNHLIEKGHHAHEAHLELAHAHFERGNYAKSAIRFKFAQEVQPLSAQDQAQYRAALNPGKERLKKAANANGISDEEFYSSQEHRGHSQR